MYNARTVYYIIQAIHNGENWMFKVTVNVYVQMTSAILISSFIIAMFSFPCIQQKYFQLYTRICDLLDITKINVSHTSNSFAMTTQFQSIFTNNTQFILHWKHCPLIPNFWSPILHMFYQLNITDDMWGKKFSKKARSPLTILGTRRVTKKQVRYS
jgi:hypothetical protein